MPPCQALGARRLTYYSRRVSEAMATAWDAEADRFDEQPDHGLANGRVRAAWVSLLRDVLPAPPARVIDLGCGTGTLSVLLAELGYGVTGLDVSPRMLDRAVQKAARRGVDVRFTVGDAAWPDVAERFDVVLCRHVLWALPDVASALSRWAALLEESGLLVLVEGFWHTGAGLRANDLLPLVQARTATTPALRALSAQADLWGGPVTDERYLITARVTDASGSG